ncbi:MAG: dTDP-4-dehydrorhamnose 3,5-epimerase [Alphaproteobacteria bacterium]|nr:dTDP-4-dehydrorhamnose 3,5-epimerase [Alphaproteobacteria bacterium]
MHFEETTLPGVVILTPRRFADDRGFFSETWNSDTLSKLGIDTPFVQDNHSYSKAINTVRGLHYQSPPHAQAKLVRVVRGSVLDVAVDLRQGSPHFGQWVGVELSADNGRQLYIPAGFLHGFVTQEEHTEVFYKCSDFYAPDYDGSIAFDDPDLNISWGVSREHAVLSQKDAIAPRLAAVRSPFEFEFAP